ncbi:MULTISPECIES: host-nuclease inhibitor Gam family protein [Methylococcus]|uniref:Prophage MuMc02, host-nuclease inhibitor protein n=1 Tax=Methylococcus capsulatus (strain ATCC 33009 / NCIMB 11132 / Bath) TaxID=243233 RepID=Q602W1_METCA|nr:host-nuclease inhibitor Gam family protein [Methylococcus capsulatus]AAU90944.1 prophage MuMc02, host-nuclease inhibitor protein [Methylococcus capsulatus str. Bath]QXP93017.1 host-nuclease inhibitor Gam family protein [Methylococcus capsulatus]
MARIRIEGTQFSSWDDVDQALREIGEIERDLSLIDGDVNDQIDRLKAAAKTQAQPLLDRKTALELAMKEFCEANRAEFAKVKTRQLVFGSVGFRLSTRVLIKRVADTLQALKDLGLHGCIRLKEEIDKEALKTLPAETLAEVGAGLKTDNVFGYEIDRARIAEAA